MITIDSILRNFRNVSFASGDAIKQEIATAVMNKQLTLTDKDITLLYQIIDANISNVIGNSEKSLRQSLINSNLK